MEGFSHPRSNLCANFLILNPTGAVKVARIDPGRHEEQAGAFKISANMRLLIEPTLGSRIPYQHAFIRTRFIRQAWCQRYQPIVTRLTSSRELA